MNTCAKYRRAFMAGKNAGACWYRSGELPQRQLVQVDNAPIEAE